MTILSWYQCVECLRRMPIGLRKSLCIMTQPQIWTRARCRNWSLRRRGGKHSSESHKDVNYDFDKEYYATEESDEGEESEETAGEERLIVPVDSTESEAITIPILSIQNTEIDDTGEWVDEEDDYEDLISLEYHPSFVKNISKRRRKWEVGWENLIQAVSVAILTYG